MYEYVGKRSMGGLGTNRVDYSDCSVWQSHIHCRFTQQLMRLEGMLRTATAVNFDLIRADLVSALNEAQGVKDRGSAGVSENEWNTFVEAVTRSRNTLNTRDRPGAQRVERVTRLPRRTLEQEIRNLQTAIIETPGCELPTYGIDGVWGPETRDGLECMANRIGGMTVVLERFPFVASMIPTYWQPGRPEPTIPGEPAPPAGPTIATAAILPGILGKNWFWAVAAGVGIVGVIVLSSHIRKKRLEEELEEEELEETTGVKQNALPPFSFLGPAPHFPLGPAFTIGSGFRV